MSKAIERLKERAKPTVPPRNSSLFSPQEEVFVEAPQTVSLSQIYCTFTFTPNQQPLRYLYDEEQLKNWGETELKPNGIRSALWVRSHPSENGKYELVAGFRRYTAAKLVGITQVPVRVFDWDDEQAYEAAVAENKDRYGFTALEQVDVFLAILGQRLNLEREEVVSLLYRMDNFAKGKLSTQSTMGKEEVEAVEAVFAGADLTWKTFVANRFPLLKKPSEVLSAIRSGKIDFTKGLVISSIKDVEKREKILEQAIDEKWSLEHTKQVVKALQSPKQDNSMMEFSSRLAKAAKQSKKVRLNATQLSKLQALLDQVEMLLNN